MRKPPEFRGVKIIQIRWPAPVLVWPIHLKFVKDGFEFCFRSLPWNFPHVFSDEGKRLKGVRLKNAVWHQNGFDRFTWFLQKRQRVIQLCFVSSVKVMDTVAAAPGSHMLACYCAVFRDVHYDNCTRPS